MSRQRQHALEQVFGPAAAASIMILALGALAVVAKQPLLFPSLAPTIFIQVHAPRSAAARPWNTLLGHGIGILAALLALQLLNAGHRPMLSWERELASALAVGATMAGQTVLKAAHPPGVATALLVTLGAITPEWRAVAIIGSGVLLTVVLERALRPLLLRFAGEEPHRRRGEVGEKP